MASLVQAFNLAARLDPTTSRRSGSYDLAPRELADRASSAAARRDLWKLHRACMDVETGETA